MWALVSPSVHRCLADRRAKRQAPIVSSLQARPSLGSIPCTSSICASFHAINDRCAQLPVPCSTHKVSTVLVSLTARLFAMETLRYGACIGARPFVAHVRSVYYVCRSRRLCTRDPAAPPPWPLFACLPRDVHRIQHRAFYDAATPTRPDRGLGRGHTQPLAGSGAVREQGLT